MYSFHAIPYRQIDQINFTAATNKYYYEFRDRLIEIEKLFQSYKYYEFLEFY